MSRKDYNAIADILHDVMDETEYPESSEVPPEAALSYTLGASLALRTVASRLSMLFARENPRFDRDKFLSACGF